MLVGPSAPDSLQTALVLALWDGVCPGTDQGGCLGAPHLGDPNQQPSLLSRCHSATETPTKMYFPADLHFEIGNSLD